jgi:hypothetical protein
MDQRLIMLIGAVLIIAGVVWYLAPMQGVEPTATAPEASAPAEPATDTTTPETPAPTTP